ncbi:MAG: prepilin-type N-terminal cleavage/methylation domain-containing protein [Chthoniobacteraceae bacterium]
MKRQSAFSLIEVTIALGLTAFCMTTLMGLIPAGIRSNHTAHEKYTASEVANLLISDLVSAPIGSKQTVDGLSIPDAGSSGTSSQQIYYSETADSHGNHFASSRTENSRYLISVTMLPPNANQLYATNVFIRITWPAAATSPEGALEVYTVLNRNSHVF